MILSIGNRVMVTDSSVYQGRYNGKYGTIKRITDYNACGVALDGIINPNSKYGVFWFKDYNLIKVKNNESHKEDKIMREKLRVAAVSFLNNSTRCYMYALYDDSVSVGDIVVVMTGHHGMALAKVVEINNGCEKEAVEYGREIVQRVDTDAYALRKKNRKEIVDLKNKLAETAAKYAELEMYKLIAKTNKDFENMLNRYMELTGIDTSSADTDNEVNDKLSLNKCGECSCNCIE